MEGIKLYMEPVQNITVDDRVSRTQYQYTLEDPDANELNLWTGKLVDKMKQLPQLADVATDQQTGGLAVSLVIDRVTASRLGIAPSTIDNTLYDAYGQRQISTMYTQLNQYHVILETDPKFQTEPSQTAGSVHSDQCVRGRLGARRFFVLCILGVFFRGLQCNHDLGGLHAFLGGAQRAHRMPLTSGVGASGTLQCESPRVRRLQMPCLSVHSLISRRTTEPLSINHQGQFPAVTVSFNLAPDAALGGAITAIEQGAERPEHAGQRPVWIPGHRGCIPGLALQ